MMSILFLFGGIVEYFQGNKLHPNICYLYPSIVQLFIKYPQCRKKHTSNLWLKKKKKIGDSLYHPMCNSYLKGNKLKKYI